MCPSQWHSQVAWPGPTALTPTAVWEHPSAMLDLVSACSLTLAPVQPTFFRFDTIGVTATRHLTWKTPFGSLFCSVIFCILEFIPKPSPPQPLENVIIPLKLTSYRGAVSLSFLLILTYKAWELECPEVRVSANPCSSGPVGSSPVKGESHQPPYVCLWQKWAHPRTFSEWQSTHCPQNTRPSFQPTVAASCHLMPISFSLSLNCPQSLESTVILSFNICST